MVYQVYVDESGDLGFGKQSSKYFVVAFVVTYDAFRISADVTRLKKKFNTRWKGYINEFKYSRDDEDTRDKVVREISKCNLDLGLVVVDKSAVRESLRHPTLLYRRLVIDNVVSSLASGYELDEVQIVVDKSLTAKGIREFDSYVDSRLYWIYSISGHSPRPFYEVRHAQSEGEPCLQVADYCSGAAFANFENGDPIDYLRLKSKLRFRTSWGEIDW